MSYFRPSPNLFLCMNSNPDFLLVYGTLRPPFDNPFALYLRQRGRYAGEGAFMGQLFDIGSYPGAVYAKNSSTEVRGTVFEIGHQKETILTYLDYYEGVGDALDQPTEFIRAIVPVCIIDQVVDCWVYLYNLATVDKFRIESGDYSVHLKNPPKSIV